MQKNLLTAMAALCFAFATTAQVPTTGLVAYWPMNGNFSDAGPYAISVTNTGATATTNANGMVNTAMFFNNTMASPGISATVYAVGNIQNAINFSATASYTVSHWFRINNPPVAGGAGFFENNMNHNGYGSWFWRSGFPGNPIQVHFNAGNLNVQSPVATAIINTNTWYNLTVVKTGSTLTMYINGTQVATATGTISSSPYTYTTKFGSMWASGGYGYYGPYNGGLDELRIYNRALSAAEVLALSATSTLPVQLSSFTATKNTAGVLLNWQTEFEQNSSHFNVQRSTDGINYTTIGTVQAKGTTTLKSYYQYTDNTLSALGNNKTIFYRLQQVDKDSRSQMSNTLSVKNNSDAAGLLTLLQNPIANEMRLQLLLQKEEQVQLQVVNAAGATVITKQLQLGAGQTATTLPVNTLSAGTYYITITAGTQKQTLPFIKQ